MWKPDERFYVMSHIVSSIVTLICCLSIMVICLVPSFFPGVFRILVDGRITIVVPYLLFVALCGSIFSIWYFLIRKKSRFDKKVAEAKQEELRGREAG